MGSWFIYLNQRRQYETSRRLFDSSSRNCVSIQLLSILNSVWDENECVPKTPGWSADVCCRFSSVDPWTLHQLILPMSPYVRAGGGALCRRIQPANIHININKWRGGKLNSICDIRINEWRKAETQWGVCLRWLGV